MTKKMFIDHGYIQNHKKTKKIIIQSKELLEGINYYQDFIIIKKREQIKIFDRNCDHAGGKLIKSNNSDNLYCPFHNWEFDAKKGIYTNGIKKKQIPFKIQNNNLIFFLEELKPIIKKISTDKKIKTSITYFNHAFLTIEGKGFKFATDPWAVGPAFNNGWWLKNKTDKDWLKETNKCDFIYISHNHPDHLNDHTLKKINKNITIIIPKFEHDSISGLLKKLKFKRIVLLDINKQFQFKNTNLILTILKSGDFRLDSGIYFSNGNFSSLLDVDTNAINFLRLPNVDLYATSYKGGASGYPLMFENYNEKEKFEIIEKKNKFLLKMKLKNILNLKAKYFLPYASAFDEKLLRDKYIKKNNLKIDIKDYSNFLLKKDIKILDKEKFKKFIFLDTKLISKVNKKKEFYKDKSANYYLNNYKKINSTISFKYIKKYFQESNFKDNLVLNIKITNDDFSKELYKFSIDFSNTKPIVKNKLIEKIKDKRILNLKIRNESFIYTLRNMMPWEDILIGFQCKVKRNPNIFNSKFWYHFSNIYINNSRKRYILSCNNCEIIEQRIDNLIYHSAQ